MIFYNDLLGQGQPPDEGVETLSQVQKKELLKIARNSIESFVKTGKVPDIPSKDARLNEIEGAFVTIQKHGTLRGCIGNIIGQEPLYQTVRDMAVAAASKDPRFTPLTVGELKDIHLEISVLSKPRRVKDASEIQLGKAWGDRQRRTSSGCFPAASGGRRLAGARKNSYRSFAVKKQVAGGCMERP